MWWIIGIVSFVLLLLFMPVGIRARYNEGGGFAWITAGPFRFRIYPDKKAGVKPSEAIASFAKKKSVKGGKISDFFPLLGDVLELLNVLRRKLRVKSLVFKVILSGDDPCDLATNYGKAWAALGNLMPRLEQFLVIKKRNLEVECDFTAEKTLIYADVRVEMPLVRLFGIIFTHGTRIAKKYWTIIEQRKGGANL